MTARSGPPTMPRSRRTRPIAGFVDDGLALDDEKLHAAVLLPRGPVMAPIDRHALAEALGGQPARIDAIGDEVAAHLVRARQAELLTLILGGVPLNLHLRN